MLIKRHDELLQEIKDAGWNPWDDSVLGGNSDGLQVLLETDDVDVLFINAFDTRDERDTERHIDWTGKMPTVNEIREFFDKE
jgi:hypothetical protein